MPARTDPTGRRGPTRAEAAGSSWRRSSRGFYVPATVDDAPAEQRIVEAGVVLPAFGGVTGWASLRWQGARWFHGLRSDQVSRTPVTLVVSCLDVRPQPGIVISHEQLRPSDILVVDGLPLTIAERSVLFEMRYAPSVGQAVVVADMAMQSDLVSHEELMAYAATLGTWTGIPRAREALGLARENSWSPQETRLRLLWVLLGGLPEPVCNRPVFDLSGRHVGTPDLLDPVAGVAVEYEGVVHLDRRQRAIDVRREEAFKEVGLECVPVVAEDWAEEYRIVARIRSAYARAAARPVSRRAWTIEPPAWWTRTDTVAARRRLSASDQDRLLRYRAG